MGVEHVKELSIPTRVLLRVSMHCVEVLMPRGINDEPVLMWASGWVGVRSA